MRTHRFIQVIIILALLAIPSIALADSIILNSDLVNESYERTVITGNTTTKMSGPTVKINDPYPQIGTDGGWKQNESDYFWVSYDQTGYPDYCYEGENNPLWPKDTPLTDPATAIFYESFTLPYDFNTGSVTIWADDTARVYLDKLNDGVDPWLLWDVYQRQGTFCAAGAIGCIPSAGKTLDLTSLNLTAGDYQLRLDVYQRNQGPFGVLYHGSINSVPEPSSLLLLASGALALCFFVRRRN
jgi:hypothetical protein